MKFDFAAWFKIWIKALTKPAVQTFDELVADPANSTQTAYIWMAIAGAISGLFAMIIGGSLLGIVTSALFAVIGLIVNAWIVNLFAAKVFKGSGDMKNLVYALATFAAPFLAVNGLLAVIPGVGGILSMLVGIYALVLSIFAVQSVYKLEVGKAAGAVLIPVVIFAVIGIILWFTVFAAIMAILGTGIPLGGL